MVIAILGAIISALGFGTANVVIKKSLGNHSIPQVLTMSMAAGAIFLGLLVLSKGILAGVQGDLLLTLMLFAIGEVALYLSLYKAFAASNVTVATALLSSYPVVATIITVVFLKEPTTLTRVGLILALVVGAIITGIDWNQVRKDGFDRRDLVKGLPWIILSLLAHAVYFPALSNLTAPGEWEFKLFGIKVFAVVLLFLIFGVIRRQKVTVDRYTARATTLLGFLEVVGWVGVSWASSASTGLTAIIIAIGNSSPLVTAILAFIVLKEKLSKLQYVGIAIMFASVILLALS